MDGGEGSRHRKAASKEDREKSKQHRHSTTGSTRERRSSTSVSSPSSPPRQLFRASLYSNPLCSAPQVNFCLEDRRTEGVVTCYRTRSDKARAGPAAFEHKVRVNNMFLEDLAGDMKEIGEAATVGQRRYRRRREYATRGR